MKPEFYEDEVIEGFYVPSMLKKAWGAQLDVLNETDIICRRHNIPYFADWGTLLSAIRHGGYIPWDDDLDISMRRKDYERFLKYAETELPEGFKVMNFKNHPGHHFFVARIVGKPRICFEEDHLTRFRGFPYIAGIDLFVLDNVSSDRDKEKLKSKKAEFVLAVADAVADGKMAGSEAKNAILQCEQFTGKKIDRNLSGEELRISMYLLVEELFASIPDEESDALVQMMPFGMYGNERYIPKEYYRHTVRLPYMDTTISVPVCFDAVMRLKFGNYMEVHKTWNGHDYPFFYGQHESLVKVLDFEFPAYRASKAEVMNARRQNAQDDTNGEIVFLPFAAKHWKYMKPLYDHYKKEGYKIHVVPIPYYYKAWDGAPSTEVFDTGSYPSDIPTEDCSTFDIESMHPAKIVIQNPFDEWNTVMTVPERYYSTKLRNITDELIYVPFFVTDDFTWQQEREYINMDHYVCMPGVINSDTIFLPSETLRDTYIKKIMEFTKTTGDEDVLGMLTGKIVVAPHLVYSKEMPEVVVHDKKVMVFFTTISFLCEKGHRSVEKIRQVLDIFEEHSDKIKVIWITQCCKDNMDMLEKDVADDFRDAVKRYMNSGIGEYFEDTDPAQNDHFADMCDAYYGDPSSLALRFVYWHKPVMIINADACH